SIRIPSAACGTVGLKPTFGELPCDGIVPLSSTLDHVGPMSRTVADTAILYHAMRGEPDAPLQDARGTLVFGVPHAHFCERLHPDVRRSLARTRQTIAAGGHQVATIDIDRARCTADVYLHIVLPEASRYHSDTLDSHAAKYSPGVRLRLEMGRYVLAEDYV